MGDKRGNKEHTDKFGIELELDNGSKPKTVWFRTAALRNFAMDQYRRNRHIKVIKPVMRD